MLQEPMKGSTSTMKGDIMDTCECGRELTLEETTSYKRTCMCCVMEQQHLKCLELGMPTDSLELDPEDFGRTEEDKDEFKDYLKDLMEDLKEKNPISDIVNSHKDFQDSVNEQIGHNIFMKKKSSRVIKVNGANEDICLTLELPSTYPIKEEYFKQTEKLLQVYLDTVLHFLAFAPMANANLDEYLAEKFGHLKGGGPNQMM